MKKRMGVWVAVSLMGFGLSVRAQNLVPNGSFEEYETCPPSFGYAQYATGWLNLHTQSADYFNRCQTNLVAGVPFNTCGYQEPADGDAYMGMATTLPGLDWYREIVGIELTEPLQAGVPVCLSFKMAIGGFGSWDGGSAIYTAKGVGLHFFNAFPADWSAYLYPNNAALYLEVVPTDTAIWYSVSGEYVPDSNYTHLAIGNFFVDTLSAITPLDTSGYGIWGCAYAFIDDVRMSYDPQYCGSTGIGERNRLYERIRVHPNPFINRFTVTLPAAMDHTLNWALFDAVGAMIRSGTIGASVPSFDVQVGNIAAGAYVFVAQDRAGQYVPVRLVSVSP